MCLDCFGKRKNSTKEHTGKSTSKRGRVEVMEDMSDVYAYRHQYYGYGYYHPIYRGDYFDSYYDDYDVRSFDERSDYAEVDDEKPDADFFDS